MEGWINNFAPETHDENDPYCFMHDIKKDGSCFVACLSTPNLIRNVQRGRGEDYLFIDEPFSMSVEGFTMQIVDTCDRARHLLPFAVCVPTAESKEVVCPLLAALHQEVEKNGATKKTMANHADIFSDELVAEFSGMEVANCFFHCSMSPRKFGIKLRCSAPFTDPLLQEFAGCISCHQ